MSNPINNGGPAFPMSGDPNVDFDRGMSLRDYFAAKADISGCKTTIENMIQFAGVDIGDGDDPVLKVFELAAAFQAKLRYMYADAMLKAREVQP